MCSHAKTCMSWAVLLVCIMLLGIPATAFASVDDGQNADLQPIESVDSGQGTGQKPAATTATTAAATETTVSGDAESGNPTNGNGLSKPSDPLETNKLSGAEGEASTGDSAKGDQFKVQNEGKTEPTDAARTFGTGGALPEAGEKAGGEAPSAEAQLANSAQNETELKKSNVVPQSSPVKPQAESRPAATLTVRAHVQNRGWMGAKTVNSSGVMVGTTGLSLRIEALQFALSGVKGTIQCKVHVQNIGWMSLANAGAIAGTTGRSLRIEAIRLALTGEASQWYDLGYQAHVQNVGWQGWQWNGALAGTSGRSLRMEALNIKLVPKATKSANPGDGIVSVSTRAHVQNVGWQGYATDGETSGTTGRSLRVEAVQFMLDAGALGGNVQVRSHVQNIGWQGWSTNWGGTTGRSLRMEAVQLKLAGGIANSYDIVYRAHVQNVGWQPWTTAGGTAGTSGRSLRVEALQVKLVKKNSNQTISEGTYFFSVGSDPNATMYSSGGNAAQPTRAGFSESSMNERFYVRKEGGGVSLQSVATGLFLQASGGKVVQAAYNGGAGQIWKTSWNGGYALRNAATGGYLSLASGKATNTSSAYRLMATGTNLIPNGTYTVASKASGKMLDLVNGAYEDGANIRVFNPNGSGAEAFTFVHRGGDVYKITNEMTSKPIEVGYASKANGANVRQWNDNGSAAQQWKATIDRSGGLVFTNRGSGKAMTATGSAAAGANVVSSGYTGASTQRWTLQASSYRGDPVLKRAQSVASGLSSSTGYLITVDLTNHRVVVFQGGKGNWSVLKNWTATTGHPSTPTVVGDYYIGSRGYSFGSGYTCYYWTQIYGGYLFHSVLYYEGTFTIQDGRLGQSLSHGCVRLDINNAKWIHDVIPSDTHVKTFY